MKKSNSLILAYTYFLSQDDSKTVSVGYEPLEFAASVVIRDNNGFIYLSFLDWQGLYVKFTKINNFIADKLLNTTESLLGVSSSSSSKKTKNKNNNQKMEQQKRRTFKITPSLSVNIEVVEYDVKVNVMSKRDGTSCNIILNHREFMNLFFMADFINTVILFVKSTEQLVIEYYSLYLLKCKQLNTNKLDNAFYFYPNDTASAFNAAAAAVSSKNEPGPNTNNINYDNSVVVGTGSCVTVETINYSRLFFEIPIFCRQKIMMELNK